MHDTTSGTEAYQSELSIWCTKLSRFSINDELTFLLPGISLPGKHSKYNNNFFQTQLLRSAGCAWSCGAEIVSLFAKPKGVQKAKRRRALAEAEQRKPVR